MLSDWLLIDLWYGRGLATVVILRLGWYIVRADWSELFHGQCLLVSWILNVSLSELLIVVKKYSVGLCELKDG